MGLFDFLKKKLELNQKLTKIQPDIVPVREKLEVCAYIQSIIEKNGGDISWLRYRRISSGYVDVTNLTQS